LSLLSDGGGSPYGGDEAVVLGVFRISAGVRSGATIGAWEAPFMLIERFGCRLSDAGGVAAAALTGSEAACWVAAAGAGVSLVS
jgi:hypothetical protein